MTNRTVESAPSPRPGASREIGFTLVEILVTLLIAALLAGSLYLLFMTNSRVFFLQERQAQSQSATRFALEQISADLKRAGYLATANSAADKRVCPDGGVTGITGLLISDGAGLSTVINPGANVGIRPDVVRVLANFKGSDKYRAKISGTTISLCASGDTHPLCAGTPSMAAQFDALFAVNMMVRIEDGTGAYQFGLITAVDSAADPRTITLASAPSTACGIHGGGMTEEILLNPVEYVRYMIETPANLGCADATQRNRILIRERLDGLGNPFSTRSYWLMADNVVDFQVWADLEANTTPGDSNIPSNSNAYNHRGNLDNSPTTGSDEVAKVTLTPELARSLHLSISIRASSEYPTHAFQARPSGGGNSPGEWFGPITSYDLDADGGNTTNGSAPVSTLTVAVVLENFFLNWFY